LRPVKIAAWAILVSANTFSAVAANTYIALETWQFTKYSGIPPANIAAYVGTALAIFFSFLMIITGSVMEDRKNTSTLRRLGAIFSSVDLAKKVFFGCMAVALIGWALTLAGVASVQAYCSLQPADMASYQLPLVYYPKGSDYMNCATVFAGQWWAWTLMTVTLAAICLLFKLQQLGRFKAATWALLISSITFNFYWIDVIISWILETDGTLKSRIQLWSAGYLIYQIAGFGLLFAGSAYTYGVANSGQQNVPRMKPYEALATRIYIVLQALSVIALIIALIGMALYQEAMSRRIESQYVFSLRFTWTAWAISFVANVFLAVVWFSESKKVKRLKPAVYLVFMFAAVTSMTINSFLFAALQDYEGETLARAKLSLAGFVTWDAIAYLMMFVGSVATWEQKDSDNIEAASNGTAAAALAAIEEEDED
jgi:hypothetical protein